MKQISWASVQAIELLLRARRPPTRFSAGGFHLGHRQSSRRDFSVYPSASLVSRDCEARPPAPDAGTTACGSSRATRPAFPPDRRRLRPPICRRHGARLTPEPPSAVEAHRMRAAEAALEEVLAALLRRPFDLCKMGRHGSSSLLQLACAETGASDAAVAHEPIAFCRARERAAWQRLKPAFTTAAKRMKFPMRLGY